MSSRALPPADPTALPPAATTPQPRVYGRPVSPPSGDQVDEASGFGGQGRHDDHGDGSPAPGRESHAFGGAPWREDVVRGEFPPGREGRAAGQSHGVNGHRPGGESFAPPGGDGPAASGSPAAPPYGPPIEVPPATGGPQSFRSTARVSPPAGNPPHPDGDPQDLRHPGTFGGPQGGYGAGPGTLPPPAGPGTPYGGPPPQPGPARPGPGPATAAWAMPDDGDQGRFDAFRPEADPAPKPDGDTPTPPAKERNGRVLLMVLGAAIALVVLPLLVVQLLTGGNGGSFNPAVGQCVKQSGDTAVDAECSEQDAFVVVSKVDDAAKCPDKGQPMVKVSGGRETNILCLRPQAAGGAGPTPNPSAS